MVNLQFTFIIIIKIQRVSTIVIKPLTIYTQLETLVKISIRQNTTTTMREERDEKTWTVTMTKTTEIFNYHDQQAQASIE